MSFWRSLEPLEPRPRKTKGHVFRWRESRKERRAPASQALLTAVLPKAWPGDQFGATESMAMILNLKGTTSYHGLQGGGGGGGGYPLSTS